MHTLQIYYVMNVYYCYYLSHGIVFFMYFLLPRETTSMNEMYTNFKNVYALCINNNNNNNINNNK